MKPVPCHLRFEAWDPDQRSFRPVPDGTRVRLLDANRILADEELDRAETVDGSVVLVAPRDRGERRPDLYLTLVLPPDRPTWLPATWDSRGWRAVDGTAGALPDFDGDALGSPELPLVWRLAFDVFLRLVVYDAAAATWVGAPAGLTVELVEVDAAGQMVLATGATDADGAVDLHLHQMIADRPDFFLRVRVPEHDPDLAARAAARGIPDTWDSRHAFQLERPDARGLFLDTSGSGLGEPDRPLVFDLAGRAPTVVAGNRVEPLIDGVDLLRALEAALARARYTVHVEMMLFFDDRAGRRVADLLKACAARGVRVRLIVDRGTTRTIHLLIHAERFWTRFLRILPEERRRRMLARYDALAEQEAARGRIDDLLDELRAVPGITVLDSSFGRVELAPSLPDSVPEAYRQLEAALPVLTLARVDHRKLVVVDGELALVGGQNIGDEYLYEQPFDPDLTAEEEAWHKWHDVFVEVEGPLVREVQKLFRERWFSELAHESLALQASEARDFALTTGGPRHPTFPALLPQPGGRRCRLLRTTPGAVHEIEDELLLRFSQARREILIANPYFSSRDALRAVTAAARRGVRVVFIFPDHHNDSVDFHYAGRLVYDRLLDAGVEVYEYQGRMAHTKCFVIDDVAVIGSANLNRSSFRAHYEVAVMVQDAGFALDFKQRLFEVDLARARRIQPDEVPGLLDIRDIARWYLQQVVWTRF